MKPCPLLLVSLGAFWASTAAAQVTAYLPAEAAGPGQGLSLAGDMIENVFVPRDGGFLTAAPATPPQNLGGFDIIISPGAGLAGNAPALAAFNRAAAAWEARITGPITVTINANLGALSPGVLGSASSVLLQDTYTNLRNTLAAIGGSDPGKAILASLPTAAQFSAIVPSGSTLTANLRLTKANAKAMGFTGLDAAFGVSDASITFSNSFSFDFDNSDGVAPGLVDFETVAAHEIGHALGFISIVDSINGGLTSITPTVLDLLRFGNNNGQDPTTAGEFTTFPRNLMPGVDTITDEIHGANAEKRMSTGVVNASFPGTDGRQASHWKADELNSNIFIGLMDPTLANGVAYGPQESDFRALSLLGFQVVPETTAPAGISLILGVAAWLLRRNANRSV